MIAAGGQSHVPRRGAAACACRERREVAEEVSVPAADVAGEKQSPVSLTPVDLLDALGGMVARDLLGCLATGLQFRLAKIGLARSRLFPRA